MWEEAGQREFPQEVCEELQAGDGETMTMGQKNQGGMLGGPLPPNLLTGLG